MWSSRWCSLAWYGEVCGCGTFAFETSSGNHNDPCFSLNRFCAEQTRYLRQSHTDCKGVIVLGRSSKVERCCPGLARSLGIMVESRAARNAKSEADSMPKATRSDGPA